MKTLKVPHWPLPSAWERAAIEATNNRAAVRTLRKMLRRALCNLDAYAVVCGQEIKKVLRETTERKLRGTVIVQRTKQVNTRTLCDACLNDVAKETK